MTRTLLETKQDIPDFLEPYKPEGAALENLKFEADSDFEEETGNDGGADADETGDAWGGTGSTVEDAGAADGGAWGAEPGEVDETEGAASRW